MYNPSLVTRYKRLKSSLPLKQRYLDIFECRHGVNDARPHTLPATGKQFGNISGTRVGQIVARVLYEMDNVEKMGR